MNYFCFSPLVSYLNWPQTCISVQSQNIHNTTVRKFYHIKLSVWLRLTLTTMKDQRWTWTVHELNHLAIAPVVVIKFPITSQSCNLVSDTLTNHCYSYKADIKNCRFQRLDCGQSNAQVAILTRTIRDATTCPKGQRFCLTGLKSI